MQRAAGPQASTSGRRVGSGKVMQMNRRRKTGPAAARPEAADVLNTTFHPKAKDQENAKKRWYLIDANGMRLGRLATVAADVIRGKTVASYTPSADMGSYVIVVNAEKVDVTGNKRFEKMYKQHPTGRPGTMKSERFNDLQKRIPERIIEKAVWGMLPKMRLGRQLFKHLYVYQGPEHPHGAQEPEDISHRYPEPRPSPKGPHGKYA